MLWLIGTAVVIMGALLGVQPLLNARLAGAAGHPIYGTMISVAISTVTTVVAAAVLRLPLPNLRAVALHPPWSWTGGIIGAFVVLMALTATPRLGAATTVVLFICGQLAAALVLDHNGWLGLPTHPISLPRVMGVLCLVAGVVLIRWF
jgi:bacterial/archaeal transporter family-2 protein